MSPQIHSKHNNAMFKALLVVTVFAAVSATNAAVVISDNLSGTAGNNINGTGVDYYDTNLYGTAPTWYAPTVSANTVYASSGTSVTVSANGSAAGVVALPSFSNKKLTLEGNIVTGASSWVALSFYISTTSVNVFDTNNPLMLLLTASGHVQVYKNGSTSLIFDQAVTGFSQSTFYDVALVYDQSTQTGSVFLNDSQVGSSFSIGSLNNSAIAGAGYFFLNGVAGTTQLNDFSVSAVPEPSTTLMFGIGSGLALMLFRRRHVAGRPVI